MATGGDFISNPRSGARSAGRIEQEAATWIALREGRALTPAEKSAFDAWLAADPQHARGIEQLDSAWHALDKLGHYPRSLDVADDPDFFARPRPFRRRIAVSATLFAAVAAAACAVFWLRPAPVNVAPTPVVTQTESRYLHLSDGSEIELNEGSLVTEQFTPSTRLVRLVRGEAQFTVAKDPSRPFIVDANGVSVRAVGTVFNVRLSTAQVEVLVTEGKVHVHSPVSASGLAQAEPAVELVAAQRTVISTNAPEVAQPASSPVALPVETLTQKQIDRVLAWQTSRLVFDETTLAEAVARFNRHTAGVPSAARLIVADPRLGSMQITGRIRSDNVDGFVELLETGFGVSADRSVAGQIVLKKTP